jgi:tight adherence protein B
MIPLVAGLGALGLILIFSGLTSPPPERRPPLPARLDELARAAGLQRLSGAWLLAASFLTWLVSLIGVAGATHSLTIAIALSTVAATLPISIVAGRVRSRRNSLREGWPDVLATLIAAVRAGVSLPEACIGLAERGPYETRSGFAAFSSSYRSSGSFRAALGRLRDEMADPIADRVVATLLLAQEVGGTDLVRVLRTLGDFVREDVRVRNEIEARWSWTLSAARLAAAAPWIVLGLMATRPEAARAYGTASGIAVILGGAVASAAGYRLMLQAARLPDERRLS